MPADIPVRAAIGREDTSRGYPVTSSDANDESPRPPLTPIINVQQAPHQPPRSAAVHSQWTDDDVKHLKELGAVIEPAPVSVRKRGRPAKPNNNKSSTPTVTSSEAVKPKRKYTRRTPQAGGTAAVSKPKSQPNSKSNTPATDHSDQPSHATDHGDSQTTSHDNTHHNDINTDGTAIATSRDVSELKLQSCMKTLTCGGRQMNPTKIVWMSSAQLKQEDASANHMLWALYRDERLWGSREDRLAYLETFFVEEARVLDQFGITFDNPIIPRIVLFGWGQNHDKWHLMFKFHHLEQLYGKLDVKEHNGEDFMPTIRARLEEGSVTALGEAVVRSKKRLEAIRDYFVTESYLSAMQDACRALSELYPWASSSLMFSADEAFGYQIAFIEAELWNLIAIGALRQGHRSGDQWFYIQAGHTALAALSSRYVPCYAVRDALNCFADAIRAEAELCARRGVPDEAGLMRYHGAQMPTLCSLAAENVAHNFVDSSSWAHEYCIDHHVCVERRM